MDTTQELDREGEVEKIELPEVSDATKTCGKDGNILPEKVLQECLETIPMSDRKCDNEIQDKEEIEEEGMIEEADKREGHTTDTNAVEAQIVSNEIVVVNEFVAQDEILAKDEVLAVDEVLAMDEVLTVDEVLAVDDALVEGNVLAVDEVLYPDSITPSMMLIVFNVILPTIDIFLDATLVQKLFLNGYWYAGLIVTAGIVTNFLFTSLAWWRMEASHQKKWSWVFLLLQLWPQLRAFQVHKNESRQRMIVLKLNFQVMLLLVKGDPKGYEEKEALEREVNCLESYLEGLPSLCVLAYLKRASPEFLDSLGLFSFYRPFYQICFTMTLFLKSGPCFILPKNGLFGGIFTWRFIAIFVLNQLSFKIKFFEAQFDGETYLANAVCVSSIGVALALVSIRQAVGSWEAVFALVLKFPPLLFLPVFGFVTFGATPKGEA